MASTNMTVHPSPDNRSCGGTIQVVEFFLGNRHFAIDLFDVREVVEYTTITTLPSTPPWVKGIIDLRGEITVIVDLREKLHIRETSEIPVEDQRIIVLDEKVTGKKIGILVDEVTSVSTFDTAEVDRDQDTFIRDGSAGTILGIIKKKVREKDKDQNELIIWIDVKKMLGEISAIS
jgi:purine-binding chemotaxis protein CheW